MPRKCPSVILFAALAAAQASADADAIGLMRLQEHAAVTFVMNPAAPDADALELDASVPQPYGRKGSRRWNVHFEGGVEASDIDVQTFLGGAGLEFFVADALSFDLELNLLYAVQDGNDGIGPHVGFGMTWHFHERERWTAFLEAGIGMQYTQEDVPKRGSQFNFTPQAGIGITTALADDKRLRLGVRWFHQSNGNLYRDNPGRDSLLLYAGISMPF